MNKKREDGIKERAWTLEDVKLQLFSFIWNDYFSIQVQAVAIDRSQRQVPRTPPPPADQMYHGMDVIAEKKGRERVSAGLAGELLQSNFHITDPLNNKHISITDLFQIQRKFQKLEFSLENSKIWINIPIFYIMDFVCSVRLPYNEPSK